MVALQIGCGGSHQPARDGGGARRISAAPGVVVRSACTPTGPERCFDARDDNCNGLIDEGCGIETGIVQFMIAWQEPNADVDLDVTDPNGELVEVKREARSGLYKDRDCPGLQNECRGQNYENVFLNDRDNAPRGEYHVRIRLEKLGGAEPPIHVTLGARVGPKTYSFDVELNKPEEEREVVLEL